MRVQNASFAYKDLFAGNIDLSVATAVKILGSYPASARAFMKLAKGLKHSEKLRSQAARDGLEVPPLMIVSTTGECNLACAGCYSCANNREKSEALSDNKISDLLDEASALGVNIVMLAGGEPLLSHGWMDKLSEHKELLGVVFTNGTLINETRLAWFDTYRHIIPALSIEGSEQQTDSRRGNGVYAKATAAMQTLKRKGIPFGISVTVTSENIDTVLQENFLREFMQKGCRLFFFVEYVPVEPGSEPMVLSKEDKHRLNDFCTLAAKKNPALFIPFPGDEDQYGGCLAAGRGFIHISASGEVEPCPFAPFSDNNVKNVSLKEALSSEFLSAVRANHHLLKEGSGGCALWNNRQWLTELLVK